MNRLLLTIFFASALAAAGPVTFAVTPSGFGVADLGTGAFTQIGAPLPYQIGGIAYGSDGKLYGLDANNNLVRIDPATGNQTNIGSSGIPLLSFQPGGSVVPFASLGGTLYGVDASNKLYSFSRTTGLATPIGSTGVNVPVNPDSPTVSFFNGLTSIGGTLYFSYELFNVDSNFQRTTDVVPNALYKINTTTGQATKIGNLPALVTIFSGAGSTLWGMNVSPDYSTFALDTFNPSTGALLTSQNSPNLYFSAVVTPEPDSTALLLAGLGRWP